jgi:hypothetical protein
MPLYFWTMLKIFCCLLFVAYTGSASAQAPEVACCAKAKGASQALACSLTTEEMRLRKETVLASLKAQVVARKELDNGYSYKFPGSDEMVDELAEFIKTERACCAFFSFGLTVAGDRSSACLELTGPEGAKDMIQRELGL